ncbi:MAG: ABC transporter substrate-binding protein [Deinococcota bacterium]
MSLRFIKARKFTTILTAALISWSFAQTCPAVGGTATIAQWSEPGNLNPLIFPTQYDENIQELVFSSLITTTEDLSFIPDLAESWEVSDDQRTITFTLQEGLTWHDGTPLTANDVAYTYTSMADPGYDGGRYAEVAVLEGAEAYNQGEADSVSGINIIDDLTISFTTSDPFAPFLATIAGVSILPEHIYGQVAVSEWQEDATNRNPLGSGPFEFVEYRSGELVELVANEEYHAGRPCLDRVIIRFGDQNTMLAALLSGEVDATQVPINSVESVETDDAADVMIVDSLSFQYLGFNLRHPILSQFEVREAIAHALNRDAMVDGLVRGYGRTLDTIFPPNHWSYPQDVETITYDVEMANAILDEAGWELDGGVRSKNGDSLSFTIFYPTGNQVRERSAPLIQANLRQIGIEVDLQAMDFATLVTYLLPREEDGTPREVRPDEFDMFLLGYGISRDPNEYLSYFVESDMPPNGFNFTGYVDAEVENLLRSGQSTLDSDARVELYHDFAKTMRADLPWIPLYQQQDIYASGPRLQGFGPDIRGVNVNATNWWIQE